MSNNIVQLDKKDDVFHFPPVPVDMTNYPVAVQDFLFWDTTSGVARPLTSDTNGGQFIGESRDVSPVSLYGTALTSSLTSPNYTRDVVGVNRHIVREVIAATGIAVAPFASVYVSDAQTVTVTGSNAIGFVSPDQPVVASTTAGQKIRVVLHATFPAIPVN